ncbi:GntR family transcriptional regulator [Marinilongibacter aquaticus]|uniref:GntR family transcriptional regulator n=1 Tax=Marinilongibacter aquaticus TaxID=2975157 RepID=UPI0021BD1128|nr:GntR family transcriptional regulator [Marinilongibacter aquaticus]UBM58346.1 GntR family transcriptional regulator [Marinilongibacter aquaticus]
MNALHTLVLNDDSRVPKYRQLVDGVMQQLANGRLKIGDKIPSINKVSEELYLSRDTVEKAYRLLKDEKVIVSVPGKGFYINRSPVSNQKNVLFLINKLSSYKMKLYNAFVKAMGDRALTEILVYHCDETLFLNYLKKNKGAFDYYLIMPHFKNDKLRYGQISKEVAAAISEIGKEKLILLDNEDVPLPYQAKSIYQDFESDIYEALKTGLEKVRKYKKLFLLFPAEALYPYPEKIIQGFREFCLEQEFDFEVVYQFFDEFIIMEGDLFICVEEADLVSLVKKIREDGFELGKAVGVISYNDTPLKELLGITVISTDFDYMGTKAADLVSTGAYDRIKNPFNYIERNSL